MYFGFDRFKERSVLLFQLSTDVRQITPSISILLLATFSYSSERPLSSFEENRRLFVIAIIPSVPI